MPEGSPSLDAGPEPQHGADPGDPLRPEIEEENNAAGTPPMADPEADMETRDDDEHPLTDNVAGQEDKAHDAADEDADHTNVDNTADAINNDDVDDESDLDEVNEAEFADFNPDSMELNTQREIDADTIGAIGVHKRKRTAEEEEEHQRKKKKKEKKREKPKRRRAGADEDDFEGGPEIDGKRSRKSKVDADGKPVKRAGKAPEPEVNEEHLSPEESKSCQLSQNTNCANHTLQDDVALSIARWTKPSSRTACLGARLHRMPRNVPITRSKPSAGRSSKHARQIRRREKSIRSQRPRSRSFPKSSSS